MDRFWKRLIIAGFCAAVAVAILAAPVMATTITTKYAIGTGSLEVTVVNPTGSWNDLEIECLGKDQLANFTTSTPNWSVASLVTRGSRRFVRLERTPATSLGETVTVMGPLGRGAQGSISRTFNGTVLDGAAEVQTFTSDKIPSLSTWGLLVLTILIVISAAWVLLRRRRYVTA